MGTSHTGEMKACSLVRLYSSILICPRTKPSDYEMRGGGGESIDM